MATALLDVVDDLEDVLLELFPNWPERSSCSGLIEVSSRPGEWVETALTPSPPLGIFRPSILLH
ncbi:hypothetical protein [Longimicrobium sp.]|uniref:hypothetical protein n=1 Tax=Longimicrobium sp. TaxID=2029185 RepID=UPI002B64665A|nr:hypothetical protein [Longimicrobium sp.]HSU17152.1 hypothetical protein [Longimicrobium sp.]